MTKPLVDLDDYDLTAVHADLDVIRGFNPQRYEMEHLSAVIHFSLEDGLAIGRKDVGADEFWVRGHIPDRPVLPGVIMIEAGAQLSTYLFKHRFPEKADRFIVFRGVDRLRFRGQVVPGDTLYLVARGVSLKPRIGKFAMQGIRDGEVVFDGVILGAPV